MAKQAPLVGKWYQDAALDELFEIVAIDEDTATIDIQYIGGEVSEMDFETWQQMIVIAAQPPEDFNASYEISTEDAHLTDDIITPDNWNDPLSSIEPETIYGLDDF